jgi:hypothetical protein
MYAVLTSLTQARYPVHYNFLEFTVLPLLAIAKGNTSLPHPVLVSIQKYLQKQELT